MASKTWRLDDLIEEIVVQVIETGKEVQEILHEMWPVRLDEASTDRALFEGLRSLAHDAGMRPMRRSGKFQSARGRLKGVPEAGAGLDAVAMRRLARLIFATATGAMASVLDFTGDDVAAAYARRVTGPRERANREEPFWKQLGDATRKHGTLRCAPVRIMRRVADLAVTSEMTAEDEEEAA